MTKQQQSYLLYLLYSLPINERRNRLETEIRYLGLSDNEVQIELINIESIFNNGINNLNSNQFKSLLEKANRNGINSHNLIQQLEFYEIENSFQENIICFLQDYIHAGEPIDVTDLEEKFQGVQVASRDNFNVIINQGWTGDWDLNPNNIRPLKVQVASMNENGPYPRGYYLNADIIQIEPVDRRFRLFLANPVIVNTGNRNLKFTANPVRYIR